MKDGDARAQGSLPRRPTPPGARERPWDDGWLRERFYTHYPRRRSRFALPRPSAAPSTRRLSAEQLRALRARWLGLSVTLDDFTGRPRCSRRLAVHRACTLHELVTVLCAAVGFTDDEHLYRFETTRGDFSPWELSVFSSDAPVTKTLEEIGFGSRDRLHLQLRHGRQLALRRTRRDDPTRGHAGATRPRARLRHPGAAVRPDGARPHGNTPSASTTTCRRQSQGRKWTAPRYFATLVLLGAVISSLLFALWHGDAADTLRSRWLGARSRRSQGRPRGVLRANLHS